MNDYLAELCHSLGIKLIYMPSKLTVLTSGIDDEVPYIKLDNMFMNCPYEVAAAVIGYCLDVYNREAYLKVLRDFIRNISKPRRYEFSMPNKKFISCVLKKLIHSIPITRQIPSDDEMDIMSIKGKHFYSREFNSIDSNSINVPEDDLLEVEVVISPFDT